MTKSVFSARYAKFRELLIAERKKAGLTQEEVARRLKWTQTDVSKVERGERRLDVVEFVAFAKAIEFDAATLIKQIS